MNRDVFWVVAMIVAIMLSFTLRFPANVIQLVACAVMLYVKLEILLRRKK